MISLVEIIPSAAALTTTVLTAPLAILRELTYSCTAASSSSPRSNGLPFYPYKVYFVRECSYNTSFLSGLQSLQSKRYNTSFLKITYEVWKVVSI